MKISKNIIIISQNLINFIKIYESFWQFKYSV